MAIWKRRDEDNETAVPASREAAEFTPERQQERPAVAPPPPATPPRPQGSFLGRGFQFRGEIGGSEDLTINGRFDGTIDLGGQNVTLAPDAQVKANVRAGNLVVQGQLVGNVATDDRLEITRTGKLTGDVTVARIAMQDGAGFKGNVQIKRAEPARPAAPAAAGSAKTAAAVSGPAKTEATVASPAPTAPARPPAPATPNAAQSSLLTPEKR